MRKRGRPTIYTPGSVSDDDTGSSVDEDEPNMSGVLRALRNFESFCLLNKNKSWISITAEAYRKFGKQMSQSGLDPASITTTLGYLSQYRVQSSNPGAAIAAIKLFSFKKGLERKKARKGNSGKKPLLTIADFQHLWSKTSDARSVAYSSFWWLLVATGARPCNILTGHCALTKTSIKFWYCGQKIEQHASAAAREYLYEWSVKPPSAIRDYIVANGVPKLGREGNIAANLNSWAKTNFPKEEKIVSTQPRVRLDNLLSEQVRQGQMTESEFTWLMGHSITTSDKFYRR